MRRFQLAPGSKDKGRLTILCRSINLCWFVFKWAAILGGVALIAAAPFCYREIFYRVEEELRVRVEATLAKRLPHLDVRIQAAHLVADGIEVRGLSISEPGAAGPQRELAHFDTMFLGCETSPQELLSGEPLINTVKISRPVFRATRRPDGSYSISKLLPLPKPVGPPPEVAIESGTIEIFDPLKNPSSMLVLRELNLAIKPVPLEGATWPHFEVQGYVMADHLRRLEWTGTLDPNSQHWTAAGEAIGLDISPELRGSLPAPIASHLEMLAGLRAPADLKFHVSHAGTEPLRFAIDGSVERGRVEDPRLPYPLTDVKGTFHCDNDGFRLNGVTARDGQTFWILNRFEQSGFGRNRPFVVEGGGQQVHLDNKWVSAIPEKWRKYWFYYEPLGDVDVACSVRYDGERFHDTSIDVVSRNNVSFSFHKFPYRLDRARGTLRIRGQRLDLSALAFAGPQPVSIAGNFSDPGPNFTGSIEISGEKLPIDDRLFAAVLNPKAHQTLVALNPAGTLNLNARLWRDDPHMPGMQQHFRVAFDAASHATVVYDKFPYPLENVQGELVFRDGVWSFDNLVGSNRSGVVRLAGFVSTVPGTEPVRLSIRGEQLELTEELRAALKPGEQHLWDALRPHGHVDVRAEVRIADASQQPSVWLLATPKDNATSIGTSIEPVAFPYRMRLLGGQVEYQDGHAKLHRMRAVHRNTEISTGGFCDIDSQGNWQLRLEGLRVDRIRLQGEDHDLVAALPEGLRRGIAELKPSGLINLQGGVTIAKGQPQVPLHIGWDVDVFMHQGSLQAGPKLENVFGRVRLRGAASGDRFSSHGELFVDSLTYKNFQFTDVSGPLWFDNANVFLGALGPAAAGSTGAPRQVAARLLGGTLLADCHVQLGTVPRYRLTANLQQADLAQFARENLTGSQRLHGKVAASVELRGTPGPRNLSGGGTLQLSEADIYDLPVMVALLKIIRAKTPDTTAFTQGEIAFEIQQGEHIILHQIHLNGDAINLTGNGELTLDGQNNPIRMDLHTSGGRGGLPLVSGVLNEAGKQILRIHVGGSLAHPDMRTEPFPVANQALQQLQVNPDQPAARQAGGFWKSFGWR